MVLTLLGHIFIEGRIKEKRQLGFLWSARPHFFTPLGGADELRFSPTIAEPGVRSELRFAPAHVAARHPRPPAASVRNVMQQTVETLRTGQNFFCRFGSHAAKAFDYAAHKT